MSERPTQNEIDEAKASREIVQGGYNAETSKMLWRPDIPAQEVGEQEVLKLAEVSFSEIYGCPPKDANLWDNFYDFSKGFTASSKLRAKDDAAIAQLKEDNSQLSADVDAARRANSIATKQRMELLSRLSASQDHVKMLREAADAVLEEARLGVLTLSTAAKLKLALTATAPKGETE